MKKEEHKSKVILSVGDGNGNLFVEGDYASITRVQNMIFELEKLRRENRRMQLKLDKITTIINEAKL